MTECAVQAATYVQVTRCRVRHEDNSEYEVARTKYSVMRRSTLTTTCRDAERRVAILIDETNRNHAESPLTPWGYEVDSPDPQHRHRRHREFEDTFGQPFVAPLRR